MDYNIKGLRIEDGKIYGRYSREWTVSNDYGDTKIPVKRVIVFDGLPLDHLCEGYAKNLVVVHAAPLRKLTKDQITALNGKELHVTDAGKKIEPPEVVREKAVINVKNMTQDQRAQFFKDLGVKVIEES